MLIKPDSNQSVYKQDLIYVSILLAITLGLGIYLIATTVVIAKDGVTFIEYAQNLVTHAAKIMKSSDQHPGYPAMILSLHNFFSKSNSVLSWIYSAQCVTLLFRLLAIPVLYFTGKGLVGSKYSFISVLILIFLPKPTAYGSDALSDWPHMFFLATGMLLLMQGAKKGKWQFFAFAGLSAGAGFLVRPECIQVICYGMLWLGIQFLWSKRSMSRRKTALALACLLICFCVLAGPYMKLKGAVIPKKHVGSFALDIRADDSEQLQPLIFSHSGDSPDVVRSNIAGALAQLFENIGDVLMWFFLPALLIGLYKAIKEKRWYEPAHFFVITLVLLNVPLLTWLYCKHGYISERHTMPLVVFTCFYIPAGLLILAKIFNDKFLKKDDTHMAFVILMVTGLAICCPKLLRPLHRDKMMFRKAAGWLGENTKPDDLIAVPDLRISFYSARKGADYDHNPFPSNPQYVVKVSKKEDAEHDKALPLPGEIFYCDESDEKYKVEIYRPVK